MNTADYKVKLYDIIVRENGLQEIMDECSVLLGNPFIISNLSLQLVNKSGSCANYPGVFDWIDEVSQKTFNYAEEATSAGYFKAIYASDKPVYGTMTGSDLNWVAARIRFKEKIVGSILVADCQTPFTSDYEELLPLICQCLAFSLLQSTDKDPGLNRHNPLLTQLLDGTLDSDVDELTVRNYFQLLQSKLPETMRILVFRSTSMEYSVNLNLLDTQLRSQFPTSIGLIYKNDCVRILDGSIDCEFIEDCLDKYIHMNHTICGSSLIINSPLAIRDAYLQADASLRLTRSQEDKRIFYYDDIIGPFLLEQALANKALTIEGIIPSKIFLLERLDKKENQERMMDLSAFLSCGRNTTKAAELRGIHKNSMYYRLKKISEITGYDLNSDSICNQLIIYLNLLGYLPFK